MARAEFESDPARAGASISVNFLSRLWDRNRTLVEFKHRKWLAMDSADNELSVTHAYSLSERHELKAGLKWSSNPTNEFNLEWNWFF